MAGRERKQKNNPGNYTADLLGNPVEQTHQPKQRRRGKNGTVRLNGVSYAQQSLFHGEDLRVPFPNAPVNKTPDRIGMTAASGTLFSPPVEAPHSTQTSFVVTSLDTPTNEAHAAAPPENQDTSQRDIPEEPPPTETQRNPLLAILQEDEIYVDPCEVTIEEAEEKGYPLLRRDVVTYRWWLEFPFDTREQPELHAAIKKAGWKWGGYRQQWNTNAHFPTMPEQMSYANAGGAYYSEENAERIEARATKARETSTAHLEQSDRLASVIPFGQPMMPGHHSYRSDLSYRKKIWRQMDLFVEFYQKAEWLENRAEGSRRLQRRTSNISAMQNRLDRLQADLRSHRRGYEEAKAKGAEKEYDYYKRHMTILASEILPLQAGIAQRDGLPIDKIEAQRPLQPGDYIQIRGRGVYVVKVNKTTIKIADPRVSDANGKMWELTYKRSEVQKLLATREQVETIRAKGENQE